MLRKVDGFKSQRLLTIRFLSLRDNLGLQWQMFMAKYGCLEQCFMGYSLSRLSWHGRFHGT